MGLEGKLASASLSYFVDNTCSEVKCKNITFGGKKKQTLELLRKFPLCEIDIHYVTEKGKTLRFEASHNIGTVGTDELPFEYVMLHPSLNIRKVDYAGHSVTYDDLKKPPFRSYVTLEVNVDQRKLYQLSVFFPKGM